MSKYDRCRICDYSEALGSPYAGLSRDGRKVKYHHETNEYLCDVCVHEAQDALNEMEPDDEETE